LLRPSPHLKALMIIGIAGCGLIVATHRENIGRLMRGSENKIGIRVKPEEPGSAEGNADGR